MSTCPKYMSRLLDTNTISKPRTGYWSKYGQDMQRTIQQASPNNPLVDDGNSYYWIRYLRDSGFCNCNKDFIRHPDLMGCIDHNIRYIQLHANSLRWNPEDGSIFRGFNNAYDDLFHHKFFDDRPELGQDCTRLIHT